MHVDAQKWADHCRQICTQLDVPLSVIEVNARPAKGESPEAAARHARYNALAEVLGKGDVMLTAQHARDQTETVFLQLLRGAGPRGLSAMPELVALGEGHLCRPLRDIRYTELRDYAQKQALQWMEDPSNDSTRYDRNLLRQDVLPLLRQRWPSLDSTVLRVASQQAEAQQLLSELAQQDSAPLMGQDNTLLIPGLLALSRPRQRNVLRFWLEHCGMRPPSAKKLAQIQHAVLQAGVDRNPCVSWSGCEVRRYRDRLYAMPPLMAFDALQTVQWQPGQSVTLQDPPGTLVSYPVAGGGVLVEGQASLRFRQGGERCQLPGKSGHTSLKKLFQDAGVPPWQRNRTPLVYVNDELAAVAGLCVCEPFAARGNKTGYELEWQPDR